MRKGLGLIFLMNPVFSSSAKPASMGGVGMLYPSQGISLNFNPAGIRLMTGNILSLNTGSKGKEIYFAQLDIPASLNETSAMGLSFQISESFKKFGLTGGVTLLDYFEIGISYNYIKYLDSFHGTGFNVGISKKYDKGYVGISLINAGDVYLSRFSENDYSVMSSTPLTETNYWGFLDPSQLYIVNTSTDSFVLPETLGLTYSFIISPNFVVAIDIREQTNNFKDLKITSENVIYAFEQNFSDNSAIRAAFSKKFWCLGIGFTRFGFETNYAYVRSKDKKSRHYVSLTFRGLK